MSSSSKATAVPPSRRKSSSKTTSATPTTPSPLSKIVTLKVKPHLLQRFSPPTPKTVKEEAIPSKDVAPSTTTPAAAPVVASSNGDTPSESNPNTPAAIGTPGPSLMPPPSEAIKKKGNKRTAAALGPDAPPKVRGKPGPKKKARLEDGSIDHSATVPRAANAAHKLGPRANQGAINAGLRALDRTGKPCRKWAKGGFKMKTFTGVVWEIPRWKAPPRISAQATSDSQSVSGDSSKENKDNSQIESEKSVKSNTGGADVETGSTPSQNLPSPPSSSLPAASTAIDTPPAAVEVPVVISA